MVTLAEQNFSFFSMTKTEPVVSAELVITPEAVSPPEPVTESVTEPVTTHEATIAPVAVEEEINTVDEQKMSAGSMMWLLFFGLVLRGKVLKPYCGKDSRAITVVSKVS